MGNKHLQYFAKLNLEWTPVMIIDDLIPSDDPASTYFQKFVEGPGFHLIEDEKLMAQLVDFGVNSGPMVAIRKLQLIVGVEPDGILSSATLTALANLDSKVVNNQLVAARVKMIGQLVTKSPSQVGNLNNLLSRSLEFLL